MTTTAVPPDAPTGAASSRAAWWGLGVTVVVLVAGFAAQPVLGVETLSRPGGPGVVPVPPLHGKVDVVLLGPGTVPALLLALLGVLHGPRLARTLRWGHLLVLGYAAGLAWMLALAHVGGTEGISAVQEYDSEYLITARDVDDVTAMLEGFNGGIDGDSGDGYWATHVAGHPPGALLFFVLLVRLGIDSSYAVGLVMVAVAALSTPAVLVTLRRLGAEETARVAAPYVVLAPAAVFMAVSGDAVFTAVTSCGLALLAVAATSRTRAAVVGWSLASGVVLGYAVEMSYGLPLMGLVALAVLAAARSWRPLPWAIAGAVAVVLVFALLGAAWWDGYPPLEKRYFDGVGGQRPQSYWIYGNLGALLVSAGPVLGVGLACAVARRRAVTAEGRDPVRTTVLLPLSAAGAVLLADLSRMSKSEVERIWLPWVPWLLLSVALLPERWRRPALVGQVVVALVVEHALYTEW